MQSCLQGPILLNPFIFTNGYLYPQRVSPHLKKKPYDMFSEGNATNPVLVRQQIVMAV